MNGHLSVLRYARAQVPPCPWDRHVCEMAAAHSQLAVLKYLRSSADPPCPWDEGATDAIFGEGGISWYELSADYWATLKWMRVEANPPCPWSVETKEEARNYFGFRVSLRAQCRWRKAVLYVRCATRLIRALKAAKARVDFAPGGGPAADGDD